MKILHYTGIYAPAWKIGGPVRSVSQICEGLVKHGHEVTVFTTNAGLEDDPDINPGKETERNGVTVTYFAAETTFMGVRSPAMENAVVEQIREFDLVHVTGVWQPTSMAACRAAERANIPYVISPRGALGPYSWTQKRWKKYPYWWLYERRSCRAASGVHYTTTMEAQECAHLKLPGKEVIIPNSVGLDFWKRDEEAGRVWREELGLPASTRIILNAGRLHHKKGLDLLPEALVGLRSQDWHMVFVGHPEDSTKEVLERLFRDKGLSEKVTYVGNYDPEQLRAVYSGADLFVLPSRHENFGNVVIEALACGCPAIISKETGVAKDFEDFEGVTVLPRNADAWTKEIVSKLQSKSVGTKKISIAGMFSNDAVASEIEKFYQMILTDTSTFSNEK